MATEKPRGWGAFDALARKLAGISKEQVEAKVNADKKTRRKRRKSK